MIEEKKTYKNVRDAMKDFARKRRENAKAFSHYRKLLYAAFTEAGFRAWEIPSKEAPCIWDLYLPHTNAPSFQATLTKELGVWTVEVKDYMQPLHGYPVCKFNSLTAGFPNNIIQEVLQHLGKALWH